MNLNEIYCMDCLEGMKLLPEHMVDLCITSPPYADIKKYTDFDGIPADQYCDWFLPKIKEIERILKPTGSFILNINDKVEEGFRHPYVYELIYRITKETGLKLFERLFWNKMKFIPNPYRFGDKVEYLFWFAKEKGFKFKLDEMRVEYSETSINRMKNKLKKRHARTTENQDLDEYKDWHPNEKGAIPSTLVDISSEVKRVSESHVAVYPVNLVEYFIKGSTDVGDLVLDPFSGSGTTAIAAKNLGRNYIGYELVNSYAEESKIRIENA